MALADHWESERCAIGIASPYDQRVLAYVSLEERPDRFYVELELPAASTDEVPYAVAGRFENLDFEQVITTVAAHLQRAVGRPSRGSD